MFMSQWYVTFQFCLETGHSCKRSQTKHNYSPLYTRPLCLWTFHISKEIELTYILSLTESLRHITYNWKWKVYFTHLNNLICPFHTLNKSMAQCTPPKDWLCVIYTPYWILTFFSTYKLNLNLKFCMKIVETNYV
jgi:hypothetical protein